MAYYKVGFTWDAGRYKGVAVVKAGHENIARYIVKYHFGAGSGDSESVKIEKVEKAKTELGAIVAYIPMGAGA